MKFDERHLADVVRRMPGACVFLLHGDDPGHVAHRAAALVATLSGPGASLFPPAELHGADHVRAVDGLNSPMLGGGTRIVRLRDATDAAASSVQAILDGDPAGVLIVEAGSLTARSRLRALVERSERGASVQCRSATSQEIGAGINRLLKQFDLGMEDAARTLLVQRSGGLGAALLELEKLALLVAGSARTITVSDVLAFDRASDAEMDALALASSLGRVAEADLLTEALIDEGVAPAAIMRSLLSYVARLRLVSASVQSGRDVAVAMAELRPPVFFRQAPDFKEAIKGWSLQGLDRCCVTLWQADRASRATGAPAAAICREAVRKVASLAGARKTVSPRSSHVAGG